MGYARFKLPRDSLYAMLRVKSTYKNDKILNQFREGCNSFLTVS